VSCGRHPQPSDAPGQRLRGEINPFGLAAGAELHVFALLTQPRSTNSGGERVIGCDTSHQTMTHVARTAYTPRTLNGARRNGASRQQEEAP